MGSPYELETACCSRGGLTKKNERKSVNFHPPEVNLAVCIDSLAGRGCRDSALPRCAPPIHGSNRFLLVVYFLRAGACGIHARALQCTPAQARGFVMGAAPPGYNPVEALSQRGGQVHIKRERGGVFRMVYHPHNQLFQFT